MTHRFEKTCCGSLKKEKRRPRSKSGLHPVSWCCSPRKKHYQTVPRDSKNRHTSTDDPSCSAASSWTKFWLTLACRILRYFVFFVGRPFAHVYPFWMLGPQDLESCRSIPVLDMPMIVHCVLRGFVHVGPRLPHHVDVFHTNRKCFVF